MDVRIEFELDECTKHDDGSYSLYIDPGDYGMIDEDDAEDYVDRDDFIEEYDDEELIKELEARGRRYTERPFYDDVRALLESNNEVARVFMTDVLMISHLSTKEQIFQSLERLIS